MWKEVSGYEGYYEVSDDGAVRSMERTIIKNNGVVQTRKSRQITPRLDADGYMRVKLSKDGISKLVPVHRLVATAYVDGYTAGLEVNHIDCDRTNNHSWNLEWITHADNIAYTKSLKRHVSDGDLTGEKNPNYGNRKLHHRYESDPSLGSLQSRPGARNGRSKPVRLKFGDGTTADFGYIREAALYMLANGYIKSDISLDYASTSLRIAAEAGEQFWSVTPTLL